MKIRGNSKKAAGASRVKKSKKPVQKKSKSKKPKKKKSNSKQRRVAPRKVKRRKIEAAQKPKKKSSAPKKSASALRIPRRLAFVGPKARKGLRALVGGWFKAGRELGQIAESQSSEASSSRKKKSSRSKRPILRGRPRGSRFPTKGPKLTLFTLAGTSEESAPLAAAVVPPLVAVPEALVEAQLPVAAVPVAVTNEPATTEKNHLSTQDLLRPDDPLRKSIEAFLLDQRSHHTRRAYGKDLKRFVLFLHTRKHEQGPEKLTRGILIAYKEYLLNQKLEHTTVDRHIATLRSFFNWLVDDGILAKSPADGVRFMNPKRLSTTRGFEDGEVTKLLSIPNLHTRTGSQHYAILMVLFYCGLRRSEICDLRTKHITTERNQPIFRLRGKGNKERLIVMIAPVWSAIQHYLMITGRTLEMDDFLFKPMRNNRTGVLRKALDPSMIFYIVTRYAKLAGIAARVSPHSCRSTAISNARDHQVPDRAIQEFAGWASPDMITRYDKRKTSIENSAAHSIHYGAEDRKLPEGIAE